eukprot:NODE_9233_length_1438_cov_2.834477.p1 GENE.NODE_9233_length_1438_cov_2.834477~~NODE_9233_length_1438_cov_2.834477.p1  ORF type:complete len:306 (-),score=105.70 NODE_9233_length_1438_cov_2.834477:287-1204(-)
MAEPPQEVNRELFFARVKRAVNMWKWPLDVIVLVSGRAGEEVLEHKSMAMHVWLLGVEFRATAVALFKDGSTVFLASQKKVDYLSSISARGSGNEVEEARSIGGPSVTLLSRGSSNEVEAAQLAAFLSKLRGDRPKTTVGLLRKERHDGPFAESITDALSASEAFKVVECREEIATLLAPKDAHELQMTRKAAFLAQMIMSTVFVRRLEEIIDKDSVVSNGAVCHEIEQLPSDAAVMARWQEMHEMKPGEVEIEYVSLQSSPDFDLKHGAEPTDAPVPMSGTFVLSCTLHLSMAPMQEAVFPFAF